MRLLIASLSSSDSRSMARCSVSITWRDGTGAASRAAMGATLGTTRIQPIHTSSAMSRAVAPRWASVEISSPRLKKAEM